MFVAYLAKRYLGTVKRKHQLNQTLFTNQNKLLFLFDTSLQQFVVFL
jgi:hypothetical protein